MSVAGWQVTLSVEEGRERGMSFPLTKSRTIIGRAQADIVLQDSKVSSRHAAIEISEDGVFVRDLDSRNGVHVNGVQIRDHQLKNLDEILLGLTRIKVLMVEDLGVFRSRNVPNEQPRPSGNKATDIKSLITEELRKFSKWDLAQGSDLGNRADMDILRLKYEIEVVEGPDRGSRYSLERPLSTLGRGKAELVFKDLDVSRLHACLEISPKGEVTLKDLGSTNGLIVKGQRVTEAKLNVQDEFRLGNTVCRLVRRK